ncbi:MAG: hypothetical protein U0350_39295 [Caldilineaceae bacterium]
MNDHPILSEAKIDAALATYPVAPLPAGFTQRVMGRIPPLPVASSRASRGFPLYCLDLALAVFFTSFFASLVGLGWWALDTLAPLRLSALQPHGQTVTIGLRPDFYWLTFLLALTTLIELGIALAFLLFWLEQPRLRFKRYPQPGAAN